MAKKYWWKTPKQQKNIKRAEELKKQLQAGDITTAQFAEKKAEVKRDVRAETGKIRQRVRTLAQAGIGLATGGAGGALLAGATGTKSKNWGQVIGRGVGAGLVGGGVQNALMGQGGGAGGQLYQSWFGGGAAPTSSIAKGVQGAGSLLGSGAGTLGNLGLLGGLYGSMRGAKVAGEAGQLTPEEQAAQGSMGELRQQLLQQLGEGQDVEPFINEMYQTQEPRYAASMFNRGLQGSSAYGVGLADLARRSYLAGENIRSQRQGQQWGGLNILNSQLGQFGAQRRAGRQNYAQTLAGLGDIGTDIWAGLYRSSNPVNPYNPPPANGYEQTNREYNFN